jgi:hypothetical protein
MTDDWTEEAAAQMVALARASVESSTDLLPLGWTMRDAHTAVDWMRQERWWRERVQMAIEAQAEDRAMADSSAARRALEQTVINVPSNMTMPSSALSCATACIS